MTPARTRSAGIRPVGPRETSPLTLVLYSAAIIVAVGAAAVAATSAFAPAPSEETLTVAARTAPHFDSGRLAGLIEPAVPTAALPPTPQKPVVVTAAPAVRPAPVRMAPTSLAPLPPKPQPRPCLECAGPVHARMAPDAVPVDTPPGIDQAFDVASIEPAGPVPPMPVGAAPDRDGNAPGLVMRSGRAVVEGSTALVGSALTMSGEAVGGLVRSVRDLTF